MRRVALPVAVALAGLFSARASASERLEIGGYLRPQFGIRSLPDAVPRDRWKAGMQTSEAGVELTGMPLDQFHYVIRVIFGDTSGAFSVDEASVTWKPAAILDLKIGHMRIPFTVEHQNPNTALLFQSRSGPNEVFLSGTDLGALAAVHWDVFQVSAGVFNGDALTADKKNTQGIVYAARADFNPLGAFPFIESDPSRGPLRLGVGAGVLYHPTIVYDASGFAGHRVDDLRLSGSLRAAFRGAYLQTELLHQISEDALTNRPDTATGAYVLAAWLTPFGIEPAARFGYTIESENVAPRRILYREVGLNWYPHPDDARIKSLKLSLQYQGEDRVTERARAHGFSLGVQLVF